MEYEVLRSTNRDEWRVEATDERNEGRVLVTIFSGPDARARAVEYAAWKNSRQVSAGLDVMSAGRRN